MTRDELIEKIARGMCKAVGGDPDADGGTAGFDCFPLWVDWTDEARTAMDIVLEEAARIAEEEADTMGEQLDEILDKGTLGGRRCPDQFKKTFALERKILSEGYDGLARAIRALKSGDEE